VINVVLTLSFFFPPRLAPFRSPASRHRHDQVASYAASFVLSSIIRSFLFPFFRPATARHLPGGTFYLTIERRMEKPAMESRHQPSINNTSPRSSRGLGIHIRYASPRRSYVRAIEKTVSSLIPPTAAFRLPAVRQRIGSGEARAREL